jgi:simple sugar transport system ATP-binding protein
VAALEVHDVEKRFGSVVAVQRASVAFERGKLHAVVGENGAGKTTLLRVAAGLVAPDAGETRIDGAPLVPHTPAEAIRRGVAMVQQHFALVGILTALENVVLGAEPTGTLGRLDLAGARAKARRVAEELGAEIDWDARVSSLGVGARQRVEIARALFRDAKVVILDEPTAVFTPGEARALYATLRRLVDAGRDRRDAQAGRGARVRRRGHRDAARLGGRDQRRRADGRRGARARPGDHGWRRRRGRLVPATRGRASDGARRPQPS